MGPIDGEATGDCITRACGAWAGVKGAVIYQPLEGKARMPGRDMIRRIPGPKMLKPGGWQDEGNQLRLREPRAPPMSSAIMALTPCANCFSTHPLWLFRRP